MYTNMTVALKILHTTHVSDFGAKFVLETKTYGKYVQSMSRWLVSGTFINYCYQSNMKQWIV
jgi:hypothetical protein